MKALFREPWMEGNQKQNKDLGFGNNAFLFRLKKKIKEIILTRLWVSETVSLNTTVMSKFVSQHLQHHFRTQQSL